MAISRIALLMIGLLPMIQAVPGSEFNSSGPIKAGLRCELIRSPKGTLFETSARAARIPAYPADGADGSDRQEAYLAQRRPASPPGGQRQDPGAQSVARSGRNRQAGYDLALAPDAGGPEMGLQQTEGTEGRQAASVRRSTATGAAHGSREPELGIRSDPGRLGEPGARDLGPDGGQYPESPRNRAGPRAEAEHQLEDVSQGSLGRARSDRFHDN